nr:phage minor tail protein L [Methylobacterium sp. L1A1]
MTVFVVGGVERACPRVRGAAPPPSAALRRAGQSLTPGDLVALYVIDLAAIGVNRQFAFTPAAEGGSGPIRFRGITYAPLDVTCEGFEMTADGAIPQPTLSITNVTRVMSSAAALHDDLIGARLIRTRTYAQFLDGGPTPDPEAAYAQDIYVFDRKTAHTKRSITWTLAAAMDQEGVMLPGRLILRDVCLWRYRRWDPDTETFDYTGVQCPYTGGEAYDADGRPTTPDKDTPSRHIASCCKARFGAAAPLPFGGFPGVGRVRV